MERGVGSWWLGRYDKIVKNLDLLLTVDHRFLIAKNRRCEIMNIKKAAFILMIIFTMSLIGCSALVAQSPSTFPATSANPDADDMIHLPKNHIKK